MRWGLFFVLWVGCSRPPGGAGETAGEPPIEARMDEVRAAGAAAQEIAAEGGAAAYEGSWPTDGSLPGSDADRVRVSIEDAPAKGAREPLVTVVVFSDFECPFCSRLVPAIDRLLADNPEDVRIVFRHFPLPFHRNARLAAEAALEARAQRGDAGFWEMHDLLFASQSALERPALERYAARIGLDMAAFRAALDDHRHAAAIERDIAIGQRLGVRGTPNTFLNGRPIRGAQPYTVFEEVLDQEVALAAHAMREGVPRRHLHAAAMAAAREAPMAPSPSGRAAAGEPDRREPPPDAVYHVPIGRSPALGPANALVTLVMFADMECPFCLRAMPTVDALRERYGNDLRVVWKHNPLPFHTNAMPAALALEEARAQRGERGFWQMHERMVQSPRELEREHLEGHAQAMRLDMRGFRRALDEGTHREAIENDVALARSLGATGTPTFYANGVKLVGAQPLEAFVELVDRRLADARERLAARTPRRRLYETIVADGISDLERWRGENDGSIQIPVPPSAPFRGTPSGAVTVQLFSDFECPFCARVRPTVERLLEEFPSQVRVVFRHHPLSMHPHAQLAAEASVEVHAQGGNDAFWAYHDVLFDNQRALARADLERYAEQLGGVDMVRFRNALDDRRHRATVQAEIEAVTATGERIGTPSILVGGRFIRGAQSYEVLREAVEQALSADRAVR